MATFDAEQDSEQAHAWRLVAGGDLDAATVGAFDDQIDAAIGRGARLVMLDLTDVSFVDSTGLRSIVRASRLLVASGGQLTVTGLSGAAERVLELTGLLEGLRDPATPPAGRSDTWDERGGESR